MRVWSNCDKSTLEKEAIALVSDDSPLLEQVEVAALSGSIFLLHQAVLAMRR